MKQGLSLLNIYKDIELTDIDNAKQPASVFTNVR